DITIAEHTQEASVRHQIKADAVTTYEVTPDGMWFRLNFKGASGEPGSITLPTDCLKQLVIPHRTFRPPPTPPPCAAARLVDANHDIGRLYDRVGIFAFGQLQLVHSGIGDRGCHDDAAAEVDLHMRGCRAFGQVDDLALEHIARADLHVIAPFLLPLQTP